MKLTRLAPALLTALLVTGSAAFSQTVRFGYSVSGGAPMMGGTVLSQPAVIDTSVPTMPGLSAPMVLDNGACGTCGTISQPAVIENSCGSCSSGVLSQPAVLAPVQPTVINQPLFIQGTNPYDINLTNNPLPACGVMQQSAVVEQPCATPPAPQPISAIERTTIRTVKTTTFRQVRVHHHRRVVRCAKHKRHSCKRVVRKHSCQRILK